MASNCLEASPELSDGSISGDLFTPEKGETPRRPASSASSSEVGRSLFARSSSTAGESCALQLRILEEIKKTNSRFDVFMDRFEELSDRFGAVESRLCDVEKYQSDALSTPGSSNERKKRKLLPSVRVSCGVLMLFLAVVMKRCLS